MSSPLPPRAPDWRSRLWRAVLAPAGALRAAGGRLRRALAAPITPGAARSVVALFALTLALSATNLFWTSYVVNRQAHDWCQTLDLLTARPVPRPAAPSANPSREQAYVLYSDFLDLRHRLGCG